MKNRRIISFMIIVMMIISLTGCQKSSERFIENMENYIANDSFAYSITYDEYLITGNLSKNSKFLSINISSENAIILSSVIYGNELFVDIKTLNNYIKSEYPNDEMLNVISESLDSQFSEMKYLKTTISENDIWNNIFSLKEGIIPEGDMSGLYQIIYNAFSYSKEKILNENIAQNNTLYLDSQFITSIIELIISDIENSPNSYSSFFNAIYSVRNIWSQETSEFILSDFINSLKEHIYSEEYTIGININENLNINIKDGLVNISIYIIDGIIIPEDLPDSYDLDEILAQPYTINEEMEINDGAELRTSNTRMNRDLFESDDTTSAFIVPVENSNIFSLIEKNSENFKEIISESLSPLGFKEISSTDSSYKTSFNEVGNYTVEYYDSSLKFSLTIENTETIDSFIEEFCNSSKPILGLNFDKYTLNVEFQEAYNRAIDYFAQGHTDYIKDGSIENVKIEFHIYMEDSKIMMEISAIESFEQ